MDKVMQILSNAYIDAIKEPRGFIRLLQIVVAIFAFATTTSPSTYSSFSVRCNGNSTAVPPVTIKTYIFYPYRLGSEPQNQFKIPVCNSTSQTSSSPYGDFSSPSQFYVFVGVMAFLYSIAATVLYVFFDQAYRDNDNIPIFDFIITGVFSVLWLVSSSIWAQGLSDIKYYSSPTEMWLRRVPDCRGTNPPCTVDSLGNFASLNVSIIFGFLNLFLWASSMWFLFKETKWFKGHEAANSAPPVNPASPTDLPPQNL